MIHDRRFLFTSTATSVALPLHATGFHTEVSARPLKFYCNSSAFCDRAILECCAGPHLCSHRATNTYACGQHGSLLLACGSHSGDRNGLSCGCDARKPKACARVCACSAASSQKSEITIGTCAHARGSLYASSWPLHRNAHQLHVPGIDGGASRRARKPTPQHVKQQFMMGMQIGMQIAVHVIMRGSALWRKGLSLNRMICEYTLS